MKPLIRRLIVVGLDGQDPRLTDRFMSEGKLPNFAKLAAMGCYERLRTTFPSMSPVAWSTFSTGVQPAKHNIFDFLDRDRRTYLPVLSSTYIGRVDRVLKLGRFAFRCAGPNCACCASPGRSGRFSAITTSGARCSACRSRFRRTSSTAPS